MEPEPLARAAIDTFERVKLTELGATAHAVLTRILLAQGKVGDAQGAARRALTLSRQTGNRPARFDATLASARVKAASGKANEALQDLQAMLAVEIHCNKGIGRRDWTRIQAAVRS